MKWLYKYESNMDTNDADYVYQSGQLGVFDDSNIEQMKTVHMTMMYLHCYAEKFDAGYANEDKVQKAFENRCKEYGLEEADYKDFYIEVYDYKPRDPNDDSRAHNLQFTFKRIPANVVEESVDEYCLRKYYDVSAKIR